MADLEQDHRQTLGILKTARGLIADENDWCGFGWGDGIQRCALHALQTAQGNGSRSTVRWVLTPEYRSLMAAMGGMYPGVFNDTHTHGEVLAAFDKAIATVEAQISPLSYGFVLPEPTPNADMALAVLNACETAGEVVARQIVTANPELDFDGIAEVAASELFYAAQDTAWAFDMGVVPVRTEVRS